VVFGEIPEQFEVSLAGAGLGRHYVVRCACRCEFTTPTIPSALQARWLDEFLARHRRCP
jgi:hypothetical protein